MLPVIVTEGTSGILELRGLRGREQYFPDNDLEAALEHLFAFYELRAANGKKLRDNYRHLGFNWLSSRVNFLFWRCMFRFVQYGPLLERLARRRERPWITNRLNFGRLWDLMHPGFSPAKGRRQAAFAARVEEHNRAVSAEQSGGVLFYRYGPSDFRTREMLSVFEEKKAPFVFNYSPSAKLLDKAGGQPHPVYFLHRTIPGEPVFKNEYDLSAFPPLTRAFYAAAVRSIEETMSSGVREFERHKENLARLKPDVYFGIDDANEVYPILFACKELGIPSVGYQLGMYARRQAGYVIEGWEPGEYQWFDNVIVWGRYWEEVIRRHSRVYPEGFFLQGANKHSYSYERLESPDFSQKNVLVPYEFWGNTRLIGRYIQKLMDLGYTIFFKFKPDERPLRQLDSYCLPPEYRQRIVQVFDITDELMARINIVAGAMTTLLFDLLPYGKETWVFETEFRLLDDMIEDGFARRVRLEELDDIVPPERADRHMDYGRLFNDTPLAEVLARHVLSRFS
ncbi:hypothetical protein dsx2_0369 [Desulfovibrio sp. X2]|uniref:hypothetical protein n=1 Tax=Desulfovibrio sp. X2 TaxID=941449 RepID=UPI000358DE5F|nr:hypothetical protein [Desulfovibrio sp. X2]EPR39795.1 hypothetical protein dsx2_0369 [Desulfovibrio sp. X2]